jgi:hypothetical protein
MLNKSSIIKRTKNAFHSNLIEEYWNLEDHGSLSFEIEKNGGEYLIVKGTKKALEYLTGILSDSNVPHQFLKKQVYVHELSPNQLETTIKQAKIPFETTFQNNI